MEKNKKGFLLYLDQAEIFNMLTDAQAGQLIKHVFNVEAGEAAHLEDPLLKMAFIPIGQQLGRNKIKWDERAARARENGARGGRPPAEPKPTKPTGITENPAEPTETKPDKTEPRKPVNDTVTVTVNDTVTVTDTVKAKINYKKRLLVTLDRATLSPELFKYLDITKEYHRLFTHNMAELGITNTKTLQNAKGTWLDEMRLIFEQDGRTLEEVQEVFEQLKIDDFWRDNVRSIRTLRAKFDALLVQAKKQAKGKGSSKFELFTYDQVSKKADGFIKHKRVNSELHDGPMYAHINDINKFKLPLWTQKQ